MAVDRDKREHDGDDDPDEPQRPDARPEHVRPVADTDPEAGGEHLGDREHGGGLAGREVARVDEEEHDEAHERDLGDDVETAGAADDPESSVAERRLDIGDLELVLRTRTQEECTDEGAGQDERREEQEGGTRACEQWNDDRGDHSSDRHGRLSDAEREPSFVAREPAHDRSAAARLHAAAEDTSEQEQRDERREIGGECRADETCGAPAEPDGQRPALAEAVRGEAPGEHREREPDPLGGDDDADLRQREVVLVTDRRCEHRYREGDRGEGRLCSRARGEHRPAVAPGPYSENGLIGRAPVETTTLFVSR